MDVLLAELKDCTNTRNLQRGKQIHARAAQNGGDSCMFVATTLIKMYAKCGSMVEAHRVFDRMKHKDVVAWTALILGYAEKGEGTVALELFTTMTCAPNSFTFAAALKACSSLALEQDECLTRGKQIHSQISCHLDIYLQSALIDMYSKCGSMVHARQVFDSIKHPDVVSWTALILGYAENGEAFKALDLFSRMKFLGCAPNTFTFVAALKSCICIAGGSGRAECREWGKQIHVEVGRQLNGFVQCSLIDMYAKCGCMDEARQVFDILKHPDVVSWTTLIMGYTDNGEGVTALNMFARMKRQGCKPNSITFMAALKACGMLGALDSGVEIHAELSTLAERKENLVTCLVDFYAKCGDLLEARRVFDSHPRTRNLKTWTALLAGYTRLGDDRAVVQLFQEMLDAGFRPDGVTLLSVLTCFSHAGLVAKAIQCFEAMSTTYGITPALEHFNCLIDILGRSNKLGEAIALLRSMRCTPDAVTWMTLLGASHKWKNAGTGSLAFASLVSSNDADASAYAATAYLLMANIYASRGMFQEQEIVLDMRSRQSEAWKEPARSSWMSASGEAEVFVAERWQRSP